jgi:hypothetical protein
MATLGHAGVDRYSIGNSDTIATMTMKLYVGNLTFKTESKRLQELLAKAGTVESGRVEEDRDVGQTRSFGLVEMATTEEGAPAIEQFNGKEIHGRRVTFKVPPPENRRGGRGYGSGGRGYETGGRGRARNQEAVAAIEQSTPVEIELVSISELRSSSVQGRAIILGEVKEMKGGAFGEDPAADKEIQTYFAKIARSRKRSQKLRTEIDRLNRKTQAIIDKLS